MSKGRSTVHVYHRMALQHKGFCPKNAAAQNRHHCGEASSRNNLVTLIKQHRLQDGLISW